MTSGYNTNVPAGELVYHVQTEHHATNPPQIETLVFIDGRIVGARRAPLAEAREPSSSECALAMEEQHRTVVAEVRAGRFSPASIRRQYTIATIDDDPRQLNVLGRLLAHAGHRSVSISDPRAALETVRATKPDLVLCDILMSGFDGYAVLRQLQSDPATAAIPVAFLTGVNTSDERHKAFRFGVVEYFTKPTRPSALVARVAELIRERNERSERPEAAVRAPALSLVACLTREARTGVLRYGSSASPGTAWLRAGELVDGNLPPATQSASEVEFTELDLDREDVLPRTLAPATASRTTARDFGAIPPALRLVVLVHSDRLLRKALRDVLVERGCRVLEAEDGEQGLALTRRAHPSVIVSSTRIPGRGAFALRRALRASWETAPIPLLFLAGWESARLCEPGPAAPGDLPREAVFETLLQRVLSALTRYAHAWPPDTGTNSGLVESVGVSGLLRVCDLAGRSGRLIVGREEQRIEVRYSAGAIVGADSGSATGMPALLELITWPSGVFLYVAEEPSAQQQPVIPLAEVCAAAATEASSTKTAQQPSA
jgi:DNA-binding response OmpR family regulator